MAYTRKPISAFLALNVLQDEEQVHVVSMAGSAAAAETAVNGCTQQLMKVFHSELICPARPCMVNAAGMQLAAAVNGSSSSSSSN
jgi:hypothetical protein